MPVWYGAANRIHRWAEHAFAARPPNAILLTHAHFDHVGALQSLADEWHTPVYVHSAELDYPTGAKKYPPPVERSPAVHCLVLRQGIPRQWTRAPSWRRSD